MMRSDDVTELLLSIFAALLVVSTLLLPIVLLVWALKASDIIDCLPR